MRFWIRKLIAPGAMLALTAVSACVGTVALDPGGTTTGASGTAGASSTAGASGTAGGSASSSSPSTSSSTSSSGAGGACNQNGDCATGPCNVCPPAAQLCIAPIAPMASLAAGACKKTLAACAAAPPTCGPVGTFPVGLGPAAIAFDGTHMWVAVQDYGQVVEL